MRDYSLLITGSSSVDGDGSGGRSPLQQGAGIGLICRAKLGFAPDGALYRILKNHPEGRVFCIGNDFIGVGGDRGGSRGAGATCGRGLPLGRGWYPRGAFWVSAGHALLAPVLICPIKNRRKVSSNSENISRSNFLQQKQDKNRELALGILSIG